MAPKDVSLDEVLKEIEKMRESARNVVAENLGEEALQLLNELRDYRAGVSAIYFYVRDPGRISAINIDKLIAAVKKLFAVDDVRVEELGGKGSRRIKLVSRDGRIEIGIICFEEARGCQAWAKIDGEVYDCKIQCYGSDRRKAMALALVLSYANVPPEHGSTDWCA